MHINKLMVDKTEEIVVHLVPHITCITWLPYTGMVFLDW
jgi:hypothetical protein